MDEPQTRVVNVRYPGGRDVYIGRSMKRHAFTHQNGGMWGNPFRIQKGTTRAQAVAKYREWIQTQPQLLARLGELKGKRLGCWCAPKGGLPGNLYGHVCHGEVLAALADALPDEVGSR